MYFRYIQGCQCPEFWDVYHAWGLQSWSYQFSTWLFESLIGTFCCAERLSRKEKTAPPTEVSRHGPQVALPPQKSPRGCIMSTPFVVNPSISWFSVHLVAFSYKKKHIIVNSFKIFVSCVLHSYITQKRNKYHPFKSTYIISIRYYSWNQSGKQAT